MKKKLTNKVVFELMERWAPTSFAYDWDNVGMQVGSYHQSVKKIMVALDVLESVVDEAISNDVNLIIAHHPFLFKALKQVNTDNWRGRILQKLIQHDITVYAAHTNLDVAPGGVNDILADALQLDEKEALTDIHYESLYKVAVYTPETHVTKVMDALSESGAGHIGNYSHCTFQTSGTGTFMPLVGTTPYIGEQDKLETVQEVKIETIVSESNLSSVIHAMIAAHPYEEVAYDVYRLQNQGKELGLGRVGILPEPTTLDAFVEQVKNSFRMDSVRVVGDLDKKIKKVAILGGSGEGYLHQAAHKKADVYITGDVSFHFAQEAMEMGLAVIDAGHYIEHMMKRQTKEYLEAQLKDQDIDVMVSATNTNPFQFR